jgi:hypothetical protein
MTIQLLTVSLMKLYKSRDMSEPKRQHLVPRCYLKKFGFNKKEK